MNTNKGRLKKAFHSSVTSMVYQIIKMICGFITSRLVILAYGSSWNGVLSSIIKFLSVFLIAQVGINGATRVALYKSLAKNDIKKTSGIIRANDTYYRRLSLYLILYVILLAVLMPNIIKSNINKYEIALMVVIMGASEFANNCWGINSKILLAAGQFNYITNIVQAVSVICNAIFFWIIVKTGGSVFIAKSASSIVYGLVPIILFLITRKIFHIDKNAAPDYTAIKGRKDVIANSLSNIVHTNVDIFFLSFFCIDMELSVYTLYYVVADGLTKIFQVITNGIEAGFGNMWTRGEMSNIKKRIKEFEFIMDFLAVLLFGCMIVLIVPFMAIYMKDAHDVNYQRFALGMCIAVEQILMCARTPYVLLVQAAGHYKQVKVGAYMEAGINILLTFILVVKIGIIGAILGTIVANLFRTIQYGWYVSKHMVEWKFRRIIFRLIWMFVTLTVSVLISSIFLKSIAIGSWLQWIFASAVTFMVHFMIIVIASICCYKQDLKDCIIVIRSILKK